MVELFFVDLNYSGKNLCNARFKFYVTVGTCYVNQHTCGACFMFPKDIDGDQGTLDLYNLFTSSKKIERDRLRNTYYIFPLVVYDTWH